MKSLPAWLWLALIAGCLAFVFASGVVKLTALPVEHDEVNTAFNLFSTALNQKFSLPETLDSLSKRSPEHGPAYFLLMNLWSRLAGADLFALRLPSIFFALLAVAMISRVASVFSADDASVSAALALVFASLFLHYGAIARMYSMLAFASGCLVWSYWRIAGGSGAVARRSWLSLFASAAAITYVHYFGIFILAAIGFYHLLFQQRDPRWRRLLIVLVAAGLTFTLWLPVAAAGLATTKVGMGHERLTFIESLRAILTASGNGLWLIPIVAIASAAINRKRLNRAEVYILTVTCAAALLIVLQNEFTSSVLLRRMRYMTALVLPMSCAFVVGLRFLPGWRRLRLPALLLWILSCHAFNASEQFLVMTDREGRPPESALQFQDFLYQPQDLPGNQDLILALRRRATRSTRQKLRYYRSALPDWASVIHLSYDENGALDLRSGDPTFDSLASIESRGNSLWVIHNPRATDLAAMPLYADWLLRHFKPCKRYVERPRSVIDHYVKLWAPCALVADDDPLQVAYDNGARLQNIKHEQTPDELRFTLWWRDNGDSRSSYTLQAFDQHGGKAAQQDHVIAGDPIDMATLEIGSLPPGDYAVKLIVYDYHTGRSQPGITLADQRRFDRELEVARFTVSR